MRVGGSGGLRKNLSFADSHYQICFSYTTFPFETSSRFNHCPIQPCVARLPSYFGISGLRFQGLRFMFQVFCVKVSGFGFRDSGFGCRNSGFGIRDSGLGLRVSGFEFRVSGFGIRFRDSGFGFDDSGWTGVSVGVRNGRDQLGDAFGPEQHLRSNTVEHDRFIESWLDSHN
jgi:hypothetical protein